MSTSPVNSSVALAMDADSVGSGVAESVTAGALRDGSWVAGALDDTAADVGDALGDPEMEAPLSASPQPASTAAAARKTTPERRPPRMCVTAGR